MSLAIDNIPIIRELTSGYMPDFLIAFTFFTSLCFAIFRRRFNHRSAEIGLSASLGTALATGLVWWEYNNNLSIRDTGSIGILLLSIVVTVAIYNTIKQSGSKSAALIITLAAILTFISLNRSLPVNTANLYALILLMILLGFIVLAVKRILSESRPGLTHLPHQTELADDTIKQIHRDRGLNFNLDKHLRKLKNEAQLLKRDPAKAPQVYQQISGLLPAEGYLTEKMARLREKAHQIRSGHVARLKETQSLTRHLPPARLAQVSAKLITSYYAELDFEKRLERLDNAVAVNEKKIVNLLKQARICSKEYKFQQIPDLLQHAEKLQQQNEKLFKLIEHTESKLSEIARKIAKQQIEEYKNVKPE